MSYSYINQNCNGANISIMCTAQCFYQILDVVFDAGGICVFLR